VKEEQDAQEATVGIGSLSFEPTERLTDPLPPLHLLGMRREGQRLMIVMPHPDDECFGCASTIARYSAEGATVSLVTMTRGGAGLWNGREAGDLRRLTDVRELELRDAAAELGVAFLEIFDYPDGALERAEEVDEVRERFLGDLVRCLRSHRPQVVVTFGPEGAYGHADHKVVSRMTVQACSLSGDPEAYSLEMLALGVSPWSPSKLYFQTATTMTVESLRLPPQPPLTTRVSIAGFKEAKLRAFGHHRTQTQEWEPLRKFVEGQGDAEVFSLVGAPDGLSEDDLFTGI
jgi:LmbE family N-acetylglucosaminyl deacetylase